MPDLRVRRCITIDVSATGDAEFRRTWVLQNVGTNTVDLSDGLLSAEFTNRDVVVDRVEDGRGLRLPWILTHDSKMGVAVVFSYNAVLTPDRLLILHLTGRLPNFLVRLRDGDGWAATEYFEREPFALAAPLSVEEPAQTTFELNLTDPRRRIGPIHNPLQSWWVGTSEQARAVRGPRDKNLVFEFGLGAPDRSRDFTIVSARGNRALLAGLAAGGFWAVVGAAINRLASNS
jgi:hypothetical protein